MAVPTPRARRDHELLLRHQSCRRISTPVANRRPRNRLDRNRHRPGQTRVAADPPPAATVTRRMAARQRSAGPSRGNTDQMRGRGRPRDSPDREQLARQNAPGYFWSRHRTSTSSRSSGPTCRTGHSAAGPWSGIWKTRLSVMITTNWSPCRRGHRQGASSCCGCPRRPANDVDARMAPPAGRFRCQGGGRSGLDLEHSTGCFVRGGCPRMGLPPPGAPAAPNRLPLVARRDN